MDDSKTTHKQTQDIPLEDLEALFEDTFNELAGKVKGLGEASKSGAPNITPNTPLFDPNLEANFAQNLSSENSQKISPQISRKKTSLRMKYEAEVSAFIKEYGDLEDIRRHLGLSKRKMCQLLMVDPSAWTRWTKYKDKAPPQIYRALHWYILLQEKHPEYKSSLWLNTVARPQLTSKELESIKSEVVDQSTNALTKKAIFYLEEENLKRNRLKSEMEDRLGQLTSMKTKLQYLIAFQAILAAAILIIALN